jgi:hypothetical protein
MLSFTSYNIQPWYCAAKLVPQTTIILEKLTVANLFKKFLEPKEFT